MPRFPFRWPVEVRGPRGERFFARSSEISGRGIGMVVDHLTAVGLAPGGTVLGPHTPVIDVQLQVPGEDSGGDIRLEGRVRHIRRLSQQQYLVGVNFIDPDAALQLLQRVRARAAPSPQPSPASGGGRVSSPGVAQGHDS